LKPVEPMVEQQAARPGRLHRGQLFRKYFLLILGLVCGALLISGGIGLYFAYQENKVALASLQREKAAGAAARIEQFVSQIEQQLAFAALPQLGAEGLEQRRIEFLKLLRVVPAVTDIAQIDPRGREQLAVSRLAMDVAGADKDRSQEPAFKNARPGQTWFGPVYFRKETEPYMSIAVRSGGESGPVTVAEVNLKFIWDVVTRIKIGQKGKAYVVDSTGFLVADPDIGLVLRKTDLSALEQVKAAFAPGADDSLAMLAKDLAGNAVLTAHAPIEPAREQAARGAPASVLGWKVFVEQPVSEVYAALDATILRTVALIVAGLLFSALAAMYLARNMVRPINVLQEGAQRIGAGELDQKIEIRTGDELEALAEQFNHMTAQLRESYSGLERKVEARTVELKQALEFQGASGEILSSISGSIADTKPVFDAIVRNTLRLFGTRFCIVSLVRDGKLELAAYEGEKGFDKVAQAYPRPIDESMLVGKAILSGNVMQLAPIVGNPEAPVDTVRLARELGYNALVVAPMVREGKVIGAIATAHPQPVPFSDKQLALLEAFADQAVIAIENARLVNETKEGLEQQTAISEILRVISGSPADVTPVLHAVAEAATRLCDATAATIYVLEGNTLRRTVFHGPEELQGRESLPYSPETLTGRTIAEGKAIHIQDLEREQSAFPMTWELAQKYGRHQTMLAVPLMREGRPFGTMFLRRTEVRPFTDKEIALSNTFADQAAIAIENVRLFNETKEALEQQKASAEVLGAISSSIADTKPVFDKILESCQRLFAGRNVGINVVGEDGRIHIGAYQGSNRAELEAHFPVPLSMESGSGAAILERRVLHYPDVDGPGVPDYARRGGKIAGNKSVLFAPMLWEGKGIGAIFVGRDVVGPFSEKEISLLKTFADQAVIAIQNARLFREIQEKSAQLEVANKHKSDFLANMSHELRTPLNAIIGFSEVLIDKMFGELNAKQADYLKDIHESGKHLLSLINDILDLSKIEAGRMDLEISSFDLPTALANAMTLVRERAQRHGIELSLKVDKRLGAFQADERKFKQIVLNLLSNAVKFTPDGGKVDVSAKLDTNHVEIAVKDTGIGIAPEDQAAVFEEFKQVGRDYTKKAEGTGLGLALTRRFVELHGGEVRLMSAPGKGSTFTVVLPVRPS
jgi:signal transduction histidine kinase